MLKKLGKKKVPKQPPAGFGWDGEGERKRDNERTRGTFTNEALARAGLAVSKSEPIMVKQSQKKSSRGTERSSRIDKSEILSKEIRGKYPSSKRQFDKYVNDYALKQKEIDEIEQTASAQHVEPGVQRGTSAPLQSNLQMMELPAPIRSSLPAPMQKHNLLMGAESDQRAHSFSVSAESDTRRTRIPGHTEDTENIAPLNPEDERAAMLAHNKEYYTKHPDCLATAAAVSLGTIKVEDRLEILKDTLRPGAAKKFEVVANAFLLLHHHEKSSERPPSLSSQQYQHDQLCVCCANALKDYHITQLGPLLRLLALLGQNTENKKVLLRYGVVGTTLKRMSKLPKAQKQAQQQSAEALKLLAAVMFQ
jgi:hypothetical protein